MAIDGFFIKNLINEIKSKVLNSRLEQVNLVKNDIFSFKFYNKGKREFLNIKLKAPFASFFLENLETDKNLTSNFLTNLKRLLEGSILTNIVQYQDDRVILFSFAKNDFLEGKLEYVLILELMGRYNNLILLKDEIIIDAYHKNVSTSKRSIVPNVHYEYFPSNKKTFELSAYDNLENGLTLSKNYLGISPLLSKYLFQNKINIYDIKDMPTYNLTTKEFYWFNLFKQDDKTISFNSLSKLISTLLGDTFKPNTKYLDFINQRLNNYEKRLFKIHKQLETSLDNLKYKDYGNSIYSSGLNLNSYSNELISFDNTIIKLDISKTLNDNAQDFFKIYNKAKRSITHLEREINETNNLINLFKQFLYDINLGNLNFEEIETMLLPFGFKVKSKKQSKAKKISPLKLIVDNTIIYIGLNNIQNEYITTKLAKYNDYWFHIKDLPGSHVLVKGELTNNILNIASMLALKYSNANSTSGEVNYTLVKNLRKIPHLPAYNVYMKSYQSILIKINEDILKEIFTLNNISYQ